ncbi:hypothetical protein MTF65_11700 [Streptomyces sp. APSN-46.1]|uniref:hypothetical protein n=1 Tax=Streptomyces sp. APSN-46.1 TaxID=2929049 RepID=UPI001FB1C2B6|nr:hypothetical protein [Streptomyces sp. APSN-46.1]MCJ1677996.1 hypothetical protein [Streptomyces sp. APSN-46.1]
MTAYFPAARLRRAAFVGALCAGLAVTGTGCGSGAEDPDKGTNGVGKLSADTIEGKAKEAATAADSVHLSGTLVSGGRTFTLDMRLKSDGGSGEVKTKENTFQLLRVGEQLYLKADAAFWGQSDSAGKLGDKYVKVPEGDPSYKQFRGFTDMDVLLDVLLGLDGKLAKSKAYTTVGHTRAVQLTGDQGKGGKLSVSLEGTPYPLLMERAGGAGRVELAEWGEAFPLDPPAKDQTVDYGSQLPTTKGQGGGGAASPAPKSSGSGSGSGSGQGADPGKP